MGVVFKAKQVLANRVVAIKMILAGEFANPTELERFRTEAEALARLQHPAIVQIFDVGESEGIPYFSMEYCPGGSLGQYLAKQVLTIEQAAHVLGQLSHAVEAAHQAKVLHRDLKPENVLLADPDGLTVKISDFGLAKKLDDLTQTRTGLVMGSPSYMSPEQANGDKQTEPTTDVYSLGAILYQCLTGHPPFSATTPLEILFQAKHVDPVPPSQLRPDVPLDLQTICLKCLRKEPHKRYHSAGELADDIDRFRRGEPIQARPIGQIEKKGHWCRRHPGVAVLLALLFGCGRCWCDVDHLAVGATLSILPNGRSKPKRRLRISTRNLEQSQQRVQAQSARALLQLGIESSKRGFIEEGLRWMADAQQQSARVGEDHLERVILTNANLWRRYLFLQRSRFLHEDWVFDARFSSDGKWIATSGRGDRLVKVWHRESGKLAWQSPTLEFPVVSLCFTRDSQKLICASSEQTRKSDDDRVRGRIHIWHSATGKPVGKAIPQQRGAHNLVLAPDGRGLLSFHPEATVFEDFRCGTVQLWEVSKSVSPIESLKSDVPITTFTFTNESDSILVGRVDGSILRYDARSGQPVVPVANVGKALDTPILCLVCVPQFGCRSGMSRTVRKRETKRTWMGLFVELEDRRTNERADRIGRTSPCDSNDSRRNTGRHRCSPVASLLPGVRRECHSCVWHSSHPEHNNRQVTWARAPASPCSLVGHFRG